MTVATARKDIERQKQYDSNREAGQDVLAARVAAVAGARQAMATGEYTAHWALRQALIDLAAVAELIAAEMPAPTQPDPAR